jgi:alcohol dehydrogenase
MKAVVYEQFQGPISIQGVPDPTPAETGVVICVKASGLCRSDWHGWMGHDRDIQLPHVPGHELAGVVESVGRGVQNFKAGDRVTVPFVCGCGRCPQCESGNHQVCDFQFQPGFTHWGSFAEYVAIDYADVNLVRLPDDMEFATAASLGCRFVTAFRALIDRAQVTADQWVVVFGCGGVGLSATLIATALGARVVGVDIAQDKLDCVQTAGAVATVNAREVADVAGAISEITGGGAHVSIDALGSRETSLNSVMCLRKRGTHVQIGLMVGDHARVALPMDIILAHELNILGSHGMQAYRYAPMLKMIRDGRLKPHHLPIRRISLDQCPREMVESGKFTGVGITVITEF